MASLFMPPANATGLALPPRPVQELDKTPPAQTRAEPGAAYGDSPRGAGNPAATGGVAQATAIEPRPAPSPVVSTSQSGRIAAVVIEAQAEAAAEDEAATELENEEAQLESIRQSAEPRGTEQDTLELRDERAELREETTPERALSNRPDDPDPARQAAQNYRDAAETTSGAEPARLLMDA